MEKEKIIIRLGEESKTNFMKGKQMKKYTSLVSILCLSMSMAFITSCQKNKKASTWDDSTAAKTENNEWLNESDFQITDGKDAFAFSDEEFMPLREEDLRSVSFSEGSAQPKFTPGEAGSGIPGIQHFQEPVGILSGIFRNVYFNTDEHVLRGKENLTILYKMASYLKEHPNTFIVVEGHCDERGLEEYNLSLGIRRAQHVRSLLIQHGVDVNQIHTVSYGKEQPASLGHSPQDWAKNRRAHFKIHERR